MNLFAYASQNPVSYVDPRGLSVKNNTCSTIWTKPEVRNTAVPIPPGSTYDGPQDGVAVPSAHPDQVYKNVDGVDLVVNPDGSVSIPNWLDWLKQKVAEAVERGGWEDIDWLNRLHDAGDHGWDDLFDKAKRTDNSGRKDKNKDGKKRK